MEQEYICEDCGCTFKDEFPFLPGIILCDTCLERTLNRDLAEQEARAREVSAPVDYYEYMQSDAWKKKAQAAKRRAGQRCQVCNKHRDEIKLDAHHRTYENLGHETAKDLIVLCRECHELFEKNKKIR